jgi:hypothetical protein
LKNKRILHNFLLTNKTMGYINEETLAELVFRQVDDSVTWCRLAQVSRRFYCVANRLLIRKNGIFLGASATWTELPVPQALRTQCPNGYVHGLCLMQNIYTDNSKHECYYRNGTLHGTHLGYYNNSIQLAYSYSYKLGKEHGTQQVWDEDGNIVYRQKMIDGHPVSGWTLRKTCSIQ